MVSAPAPLEGVSHPLPTVPPPLPGGAARRTPEIVYYKVDSRRVRWCEWWRSTSLQTAVIAWVCGRLGMNLMASQRVPRLRDWSELEIPADAVPGDVREKFAVRAAALRAAGFAEPVLLHVVNHFNGYEEYAAIFAGPSGHTLGRIFWSRPLPGRKVRGRFETGFLTRFDDGRSVCTCDLPPSWDEPPGVHWQCRRAPAAELSVLHADAVALHAGGASPLPARTPEQLWEVYNADRQTHAEFYARRGLFTPPSAVEASADAGVAGAANEAGTAGSRFGAAWAELQRVQMARPGIFNGKILLVLTLLAAVVFGYRGVTGSSLAVLVGVLFFHELGHYLAMRAFQYQDVKMFFLPGFGAAVTGRHYNVPGWKKAVVSLLGPLPGIWVGAALGGYAVFAGNDLLGRVALMLLSLNLINLLPVVPLDGGWFWNSVFFSRVWWLEVLFKAGAGVCGLAASAAGMGRVWTYLGVATLVALPGAWMQGRVVATLRRRGFATAAGRDDRVPFATAETIFGELDTAGKGKLNAKTLAAHALQVFQRLNATPPNWLETLGLASIYFVSVGAAVVGLGLVAASRTDPARLAAAGSKPRPEPPLVLDAAYHGGSRCSPATEPDEHASPRLIFAQFASEADAGRTYQQLALKQPPAVALALFGRSVLVQTPARRNGPAGRYADVLTHAGATVNDEGNRQTWFTLNVAATAASTPGAAEIFRHLDLWLKLPPDLRPAAPWIADSDPAVWRACETYRRVQEVESRAQQDPALLHRQWWDGLLAIVSRGRSAVARTREMLAAMTQAKRHAVETLRAAHDPDLDDAVLAHELQRPSELPGNASTLKTLPAWRARLRQLLTHQEPAAANADAEVDQDVDGDDEDDSSQRDYVSGEARPTHDTVTLKNLRFGNPTRNLPALADWLVASGCTDLRYGVQVHRLSEYAGNPE